MDNPFRFAVIFLFFSYSTDATILGTDQGCKAHIRRRQLFRWSQFENYFILEVTV
jgi:hypothetical protein